MTSLPGVAVFGGRGRLGTAVTLWAERSGRWTTLPVSRGETVGPADRVDVVIDVSAPAALPRVEALCRARRLPLVEAVSGLGDRERSRLAGLAEEVPVVVAPNLSFGHYLQGLALEAVARGLGWSEWEATVAERHPVHKLDRPSATALSLAERCRALGAAEVEIDSERSGPPVADHAILFESEHESLRIDHRVGDLAAAARGALTAAAWVLGKGPGLWPIADVYSSPRGPSRPA
jgi:4-hydroxy-tetrahydrodipicolinate reductase